MTTETTTRRRWSWLSFVVGAAAGLVILGATWGGVAAAQAANEQARMKHAECLLDAIDTHDLAAAEKACPK